MFGFCENCNVYDSFMFRVSLFLFFWENLLMKTIAIKKKHEKVVLHVALIIPTDFFTDLSDNEK